MKKIHVFNNLTKSKEELTPNTEGVINIYTCGPTVYDHSHIGHARSAITWDYIVRFLRSIGYSVNWTRNITDIDDKILKRAEELKINPEKVARIYTHSFHEDMKVLNIEWPDYEPQATQYLQQMYFFIDELIKKGNAYTADGDVYFSVQSFKDYGKLKGQNIEELEKGFGRIEPNEKKKHNLDFALWKGLKNKNEYGFNSPWGRGRPGWHLECSAMNHSIYNTNLDIHGGGDDLIFPHHENEIAQSEALCNKTFAKYWLHNGMIMVNGKKMSKSEGNFLTIKDALNRTSSEAIRFFVLNSHYKMPLNYTEEALISAQNGVMRLKESLDGIETEKLKENNITTVTEFIDEFNDSMCDDFNSPKGLAILFKVTDFINKEKEKKKKTELQATLLKISDVLGFSFIKKEISNSIVDSSLNTLVESLIEWRTSCKINKNYEGADRIRDILIKSNIDIRDSQSELTKWKIKI